LPGFYSKTGGVYFLAVARNAVRQKAYARTDVRLNKAYVFDRRKITLFAEAVNLLDRDSLLFTSFNGYDPATGQSRLSMAHMFPILPSAGLVFEF